MKQRLPAPFLVAALAAACMPAAATAQDATTGVEDQMLLDGTPPTTGAEIPSSPESTAPTADATLADTGEADLAPLDGGADTAGWIGMTVVDTDGTTLGEVSDVIGNGGTVDTVIVRRADGGMGTIPVAALMSGDGVIVADRSQLQ